MISTLTKFNGEPLSDFARKTINELWELHEKTYRKNKELSDWKKKLKIKIQELEGIYKKDKETKQLIKVKEGKIDQKRDLLNQAEAKELLLEKFFTLIDKQLNKYLNSEKKELIRIFENLWDKYSVSLEQLKRERDDEVRRLDEFLIRLGFYG